MKKRILSMLLAIVMVLGMLPAITPTAEAASDMKSYTLAANAYGNLTDSSYPNTFKLKMTWNTDDALSSVASNANIHNSYIQVYFSGSASNSNNSGWYKVENYNRFYLCHDVVQSTNGKASSEITRTRFHMG